MKKQLFIIAMFAVICFGANGQTNLTFTRVINLDTILVAQGSLHPNSSTATYTVPDNRVWKLEYMYYYQYGSAGYFNTDKIYLSNTSYPILYADYNRMPVWLKSGGYVHFNNSTISGSGWTSSTRFLASIIEFSTQ